MHEKTDSDGAVQYGGKTIWVADSETDPFKRRRIPKPFLWGCYNGIELHQFDTTRQFVDFWKDKSACVVYARNGGKFDYHYLLEYLDEFSEVMIINGRLSKMKLGEVEFRDSINITPFAMKEYKKEEIDYRIFEADQREKPANKIKIRDYHRSDLITEYEIVITFLRTYGYHLTFSGAAMAYWSKLTKTKVPKSTEEFHETFKKFYYGGRVEAYRIGEIEGPIYSADINSAYPSAMCDAHPWGDTFTESRYLPTDPGELSRAFIVLDAPSNGAFPTRTKEGLNFPRDGKVREFQVTGHEFIAAKETGALPFYTIKNVISFAEAIRFQNYVDHFFALKSAAKARGGNKDVQYIFSKFMLNGLYGKFGSSPDAYEEYLFIKPCFIEACEQADGYKFNGLVGPWALMSRALPKHKRHYYNVATAASITGSVRAKLWRAMCATKGLLYVDTDNVKYTGTAALDFDATKLGDWSLEGTYDHGGIGGKKLYALHSTAGGWTTASKGVQLSARQIMRIARGESIKHYSLSPTYSLSRGTVFAQYPHDIEKTFTNRRIQIKSTSRQSRRK